MPQEYPQDYSPVYLQSVKTEELVTLRSVIGTRMDKG